MNIEKKNLIDVVEDSISDYAAYIIQSRAIPDFRDGLKPSQRRLLWQLHVSRLGYNSKHAKLAKVSGNVSGNYHPHGSASIDGVAVDLSQSWKNNLPLVDIHGNNGSITGESAAASRYIEARQSVAAHLLLDQIDRGAVDFRDNYDGTTVEPVVLPAAIPMVGINGTNGIAIGIATSILPHNPIELLDALIALTKNHRLENSDLLSIIPGPDFPTGATIINPGEAPLEELTIGKASFTVRSVYEIVDGKEPRITFTEIPFSKTTEKLVEKMATVLEKVRHLGITDVYDDTTNNQPSISVIFKKGTTRAVMEQVVQTLFQKTDLELKLHCNNLMIVDGRPQYLSLRQYLELFRDYRLETLRRIWVFDRQEATDKREIVQAQLMLFDQTDEVVRLAKESVSKADLASKLQTIGFSERQAEYVSGMPIHRLSRNDDEWWNKLRSENTSLTVAIETLSRRLDDEKIARKELIKDFNRSKKLLGDVPRRTRIIDVDVPVAESAMKIEDLIESKPVMVVIKRGLEVLRIGRRAYANQIDTYKNNDIVSVLEANTDDWVSIITKNGRAITRRVDDLPSGNLDLTVETLNRQVDTVRADDECVGGLIIPPSGEQDDRRAVTLSAKGYMKVLGAKTLKMSTTTRAYVKKSNVASGLKNNDSLIAVLNVSTHQPGVVTVFTDATRKASATQTVDLSAHMDRADGNSGSGFRAVNTRSGEYKILRWALSAPELTDRGAQDGPGKGQGSGPVEPPVGVSSTEPNVSRDFPVRGKRGRAAATNSKLADVKKRLAGL